MQKGVCFQNWFVFHTNPESPQKTLFFFSSLVRTKQGRCDYNIRSRLESIPIDLLRIEVFLNVTIFVKASPCTTHLATYL